MNIWAAIPLAAFLAYAVLLLLVFPNTQRQTGRTFAYFIGVAAFWSFCSFMLTVDPNASAGYLLAFNKLVVVAIPWTAVAYYHFIRVHDNKSPGLGVYTGYVAVLALLVLSLTGRVVANVSMVDGFIYHDIKPWDSIIAVALLPFLAASGAILSRRFRAAGDSVERNRASLIIAGWGAMVLFGYITPFVPATAGLPTDHLGSLLNVYIIAFAIFRYRLLDIKSLTARAPNFFLFSPVAVMTVFGSFSVTSKLSGFTFTLSNLNIWAVIPLVVSLVYLVLLWLVLQNPQQHKATRYFAYFIAVAALWSFSSFMLHLESAPENTLFWNQVLIVFIMWTLLSYYHFIRIYVGRRAGWSVYVGYGLMAVLTFLAFNGNLVSDAYVIEGVLYNDLGYTSYLMSALGIIFLSGAVYNLVHRYRLSTDPFERNRIVYLIIGPVIILLSSLTNLSTNPKIYGLPLDHIGSFINAAIIAYAITRYHLFDIKLVARRSLTLIGVVTAIAATYVTLILIMMLLFPDAPTATTIGVAGVIVTLLALSGRSVTHFISVSVDRLFYRDTYKYRLELLDFSSKMSHILSLDELSQALLPPLAKALGVIHAALLFQDNKAADFSVQYTYPENHEIRGLLRLPADNPIIEWMDREGKPLSPAQVESMPELKGLWQTEKEQLTGANLALLHPIKSRGKLIGLIAVGQKRRGGVYATEDLELIDRISSQAGVIIENAQLYVQATIRGNTDELTGLYNHRHFHERIEQEIARGSRFGITFSLIILDLDLFKVYNDIYGHLAGDQLLRKVGKLIQGGVRSIDLAFRYGGEEFAILLPETRMEDAYRVAERLRKTIESKSSFREMPVTASLGISTWPTDGVMKEEIIHRADTALYRAKQTGRNRTCIASDVIKPSGPSCPVSEPDSQSKPLSIIYALAATVDAKDHYTYGHSRKVSEYAVSLAEALSLPQETVHTIRAAGLLHDIGKIGVPDSILTKPAALEQKEWEPIRTHPELGVEILKHVVELSKCLPAILHHHENWDGTGYPRGVKGEAIPLEARILSVADAYDAITSPRPYRTQLSLKDAMDELRRCAGTQFDPALVPVFCELMQPGGKDAAIADRRSETQSSPEG